MHDLKGRCVHPWPKRPRILGLFDASAGTSGAPAPYVHPPQRPVWRRSGVTDNLRRKCPRWPNSPSPSTCPRAHRPPSRWSSSSTGRSTAPPVSDGSSVVSVTCTPWSTTAAGTTAREERSPSTPPSTGTSTTSSASSTDAPPPWSGTATGAPWPSEPRSGAGPTDPYAASASTSRRCRGWICGPPVRAAARTAPTKSRPDPAERDARAAERFFRRMVGDGAWDRLPDKDKAARRADGAALSAELDAIRISEAAVRRRRHDRPDAVRPGRALGDQAPPVGGLAGRAHARRRAGRVPGRRPRRPPDPSRRLRRLRASGHWPAAGRRVRTATT